MGHSRTQVDGFEPGRNNYNGFLAGGQIGYNFQMGAWVAGAEVDLQYSTIGDSTTAMFALHGGASTAVTNRLDAFSTARVRLGYAFDNLLLYGTAG